MQTLLILGRQPALGLAELESLYGAAGLRHIGGSVAVVESAEVDFKRLGGSLKAARMLTTIEANDWRKLEAQLLRIIPDELNRLPEGKIQLGISTYGLPVNTGQLLATGLNLKKALRKLDRSVRLIPNKDIELNSASVLHNNLTGPVGCELILAREGSGRVIVARTTDVQDIDSYTLRDRGRPKRDAKVGMLPPKLAQIIINLARPIPGGMVLDPFCGTGVVLQEALLMGFSAYGTDLEPRMVAYSQENLEWLLDQAPWLATNVRERKSHHFTVEVQDATAFRANRSEHDIEAVASETYLGKPFTALPSPEILNQTVSECNLIIKKFLRAISDELITGMRLCLAVPAWQLRPGKFKHLPLIDSLLDMGYNRISFEHVGNEELIYYREGQIVARHLLVLEKI